MAKWCVSEVMRQGNCFDQVFIKLQVAGNRPAEAGEIRFIVIDGPGKAALRTAPDALVREVIDACCV